MKNEVVYNACFGGFHLSRKAVNWLENNGSDENIITLIKENKNNEYIDVIVTNYYRNRRHDPDLISVVKALGKEANDTFSELTICNISGDRYYIQEYDGSEDVLTPDDIHWTLIDHR